MKKKKSIKLLALVMSWIILTISCQTTSINITDYEKAKQYGERKELLEVESIREELKKIEDKINIEEIIEEIEEIEYQLSKVITVNEITVLLNQISIFKQKVKDYEAYIKAANNKRVKVINLKKQGD